MVNGEFKSIRLPSRLRPGRSAYFSRRKIAPFGVADLRLFRNLFPEVLKKVSEKWKVPKESA
jgi:hypothetical protein